MFLLFQLFANSQAIFNNIIEDTVSHIMCSVIPSDSGYYLRTGTGNEYGTRSYAITLVNLDGNIEWKEIYGDNQVEYWEGYSGSYSVRDTELIMTGIRYYPVEEKTSIYLDYLNAEFELDNTVEFLDDTVWKRAFGMLSSVGGDIYICGQIYVQEYDAPRLLLIKIDENNNLLWSNIIGDDYESGNHIIESRNNELVIGGMTISYNSDEDWYLIKTDTAGNLLWERNYGNSVYRDGMIKGLIETNDSSYLACGAYPVAKYGAGSGVTLWDGCLRKVSSNGDLLWTKYYRTFSKIDNPDMIHMENSLNSILYRNGNLYLLGNNRNSYGASRGYLQKITEDGNICWNRDYYAIDTSSTYQWLVSFKNTSDGGFILAGYGNEYDRQGYDPPQQSWLVKTDSMGLDGLSNAELPDLNVDLDLPESVCIGDTISVYAYISGKSAPYTIEISAGQVIDSIYYPPTFVPVEIGLTHVDLEWGGSTYFQQTISEATLTNHEWGQCIAQPVDFYTPLTADTHEIYITVTDAYGESTTITKEINAIDCGVDKLEDNLQTICSVYPNPAVDKIYVNIPNLVTSTYFDKLSTPPLSHQACALEIINSLGSVVYRHETLSPETELNIKDLLPGNYTIRIYTGDKIKNLRFEKV